MSINYNKGRIGETKPCKLKGWKSCFPRGVKGWKLEVLSGSSDKSISCISWKHVSVFLTNVLKWQRTEWTGETKQQPVQWKQQVRAWEVIESSPTGSRQGPVPSRPAGLVQGVDSDPKNQKGLLQGLLTGWHALWFLGDHISAYGPRASDWQAGLLILLS